MFWSLITFFKSAEIKSTSNISLHTRPLAKESCCYSIMIPPSLNMWVSTDAKVVILDSFSCLLVLMFFTKLKYFFLNISRKGKVWVGTGFLLCLIVILKSVNSGVSFETKTDRKCYLSHTYEHNNETTLSYSCLKTKPFPKTMLKYFYLKTKRFLK